MVVLRFAAVAALYLMCVTGWLGAQQLTGAPTTRLPKPLKGFVWVTGGQVELGGGYQLAYRDHEVYVLNAAYLDTLALPAGARAATPNPWLLENTPLRLATLPSFALMAHEVTNAEFRPFVQERLRPVAERVLAPEAFARLYAPHTRTDTAWLAHWWQLIPFAAQAGYCMDSTATAAEFQWAYMDPLLRYYLFHPAYDNYPALGVSWQAANDYAQWLTLRVNAERAAKRLPPVPALRLPTEAEWEYAARGGVTGNVFPWPGPLTVSFGGRGKTRAGYLANYKPLPGNYHEDGFLFTAPVGNFPPNYLGLYDMAGNAAEWTHDRWLYQPSRTDSLTHWLATADTSETPLTSPLLSVLPPHEALRDSLRVVRGGSWACPQACLLCGSRTYWPQHQQSWRIGFRLAYSLVQERY